MLALAVVFALLPAPARAVGHPGAKPGEAFTFKFSVGPIESGRARMAVGLPVTRAGQRLVSVRGQAETSKWLQLFLRLNDDYLLKLDAATLLPVEVESIERGVRDRHITSKVRGRTAEIDVTAKTSEAGRSRRVLPELVRDPLSALFALRAAPLADGQQLALDILDGTALWRARLAIHRGEHVRLERDGEHAPSHAAIRIDGELTRIDDSGRRQAGAPRHLQIWLSDDDDRLLLLLEGDTDLGKAQLELTSYTPGRKRADASPSLPGLKTVP